MNDARRGKGLPDAAIATVLAIVLVACVGAGVWWWTRPVDVPLPPAPQPTASGDSESQASLLVTAVAEALSQRDGRRLERAAAGNSASDALLKRWLDNARTLRLADVSMRYVDEVSRQGRTWTADVEVRYRSLADPSPTFVTALLRFREAGDRVRVVGAGGPEARTPLWMLEDLEVARRGRVMTVAAEDAALSARDLQRYALRATPQVRRVLSDWRGPLVLEMPATAEQLHQMLDARPGQYDAVAAVTTTTDGSLSADAPVHVLVNPTVFASLRPAGAQVVITHEAVHVATDAAITRMPLWLMEGFADYVALDRTGLPDAVTARQVLSQVREDGPPGRLPGSKEFATTSEQFGTAYEAAWLAVRLLAERYGVDTLVALYEAVDGGEDVSEALPRLTGLTVRRLTAQWQDYLVRLAG